MGSHKATLRTAISRRRFLTGLAACGTALVPGRAALAAVEERRLSFSHNHTGEWLSTVYYAGGQYIEKALADINYLLRDFRTGDVTSIDVALLDTLATLRSATGSLAEFQVISAYRSAQTNRMLRANSSGVARKSLHMQGRAIDVRLSGFDTAQLRKAAVALRRGGVGYYPKSNFIHIDTGRVRTW